MFKEGDKVWDFTRGWGVVILIMHSQYSVRVKFSETITIDYTEDGREYSCCNRILFFEEISVSVTALKRPKWRAKEGERYYYVTSRGTVNRASELSYECDNDLFEVGNYFKTEEEAKESKFYKIFHGEGSV